MSRPRRWSPRCPRRPPPGAFLLHFSTSKGEGNGTKIWLMEPRVPDTWLVFCVLVAVREATIDVCFCPSAMYLEGKVVIFFIFEARDVTQIVILVEPFGSGF
uniref:Uncharacterized protein n=1 Tax=Triticum urartu TaxID=4572 RepID=A0A8R7V2S1_TRIUA